MDPQVEAGYQASLEQVEAWGRLGREQLARAQAVQAVIGATDVHAWSPARDVRVTLRSTGLLAGLELSERALEGSMPALGRTITATVRAALGQVEGTVGRAVADAVGESDPLARSVRARYRDTFASLDAEDPPQRSTPL